MNFFGWKYLETAVTGVIGLGKSGVASRCQECALAKREMEACGGFGEGCVVKLQPEPPRSTR